MNRKPSLSDWFLLLLLAVIWGSSFILMKKGLESFLSVQVASLRVIITALVLIPFAIVRRKEIRKEKIKYILLQGLFGNFLPAFLFTAAQKHIDSSMAGILNSLSPVFVFLLGIIFFSTGYTGLKLAGMVIAFSGSVLLLFVDRHNGVTGISQYGWLIVIATVCYGISANLIKKYLSDVHPITITAMAFSMLVIPALFILSLSGFTLSLHDDQAAYASLGYIAILGIFGSGLASIIYNKVIHRTTALFAASVTYLIPIVAVFWGLLAGEPIGAIDYVGMGLIFCGVYLVGK
ncbi:MAG: DMT family transporter [Chitinophagales bacterium]|nr:DMT family transporter [Chitinophagales bacterium]